MSRRTPDQRVVTLRLLAHLAHCVPMSSHGLLGQTSTYEDDLDRAADGVVGSGISRPRSEHWTRTRRSEIAPRPLGCATMKFRVLLPVILACLFAVVGQAPGQQRVVRDSEAASHVGESVTVEGTVASVHGTRSGTTFLNFGAAYPKQTFTALIFSSATSRFPQQWEGKHVRVTGKVRLYRDQPEVVLEAASSVSGTGRRTPSRDP